MCRARRRRNGSARRSLHPCGPRRTGRPRAAPLAGKEFDAVVDVSRHPGQVRRAVAALKQRVEHWTFVSTVSVYADNRTTGQRADAAPLRAPTALEIEHSTDETYGAAKVACEQAVGENAFICRAGLIVGPEDPTGRFTYWPTRLDRGGEVLVPGTPDDAVQLIDVRDLARWIVHAAQTRLTGYFDGIGPSYTRGRFLAECADALPSSCGSPPARSPPARSPGSTALFWRARTSGAGPARVRCRCGFRCRNLQGSTRATPHRRARVRLDRATTFGDRPRHLVLGAHRRRTDHRSHGR